VVLVSGCAYYNTFFLAKKYYNEAIQTEKKNTTGKLSPQASSSYDKSITQCAKILKRYEDSKWVDDALFLMGKAYFGKEQYGEARRYLNELVQNHRDSPFVTEGRFWVARTWLADGDYDRARSEFGTLVAEKPDFPLSDQVLLYTAQSWFEEENYEEAIRTYRQMLDRFPKSGYKIQALLGLGDALYEDRTYDEAAEAFRRAVLAAREPRVRLDARIKAARCLEKQDRFDDALDNYKAMVAELVTGDMYDRLIHGTPAPDVIQGTPRGNETNLDQYKEIDQYGNEVFRNPAAYNNPNFNRGQPAYDPNDPNDPRNPNNANYDPSLAAQAQANTQNAQNAQNASNLARTAAQFSAGNVGSQQAASQALAANPMVTELPRIMLGEGQVLAQLGRYDDAMEILHAVVSAWPRTPQSAEALFRIGYIQELYLEDYEEARTSYTAVRQQGQSIYSEQAERRAAGLAQLQALEAADSLKTGGDPRAKEAEKDFLAAELAYFQQEKPEKALEEYASVEKNYPGTPFAPKAAMARAWILTNAMRDTTAGRAVYESIVEKYPDSEQYRLVHQILTGEILPEEPAVVVDTTLTEDFIGPLPEGVVRPLPVIEAAQDTTGAPVAGGIIAVKSRLAGDDRKGLPKPLSKNRGDHR